MVTSITPVSTMRQLLIVERKISIGLGWFLRCLRLRKSSVSASERRMRKTKGMMAQPMSSGIRQPQAVMCAPETYLWSRAPRVAAKTTATCWLPDCHEVKKRSEEHTSELQSHSDL